MAPLRRCLATLALLALAALAERSADNDAMADALALDAQEPEDEEVAGAGGDGTGARRARPAGASEELGAEDRRVHDHTSAEAFAERRSADGDAADGAQASLAWAPEDDVEAADEPPDEEDAQAEERFAKSASSSSGTTRSGGFDYLQAWSSLVSVCGAGASDPKCAEEVFKLAGRIFAAMLSTDREQFTAEEKGHYQKRFTRWMKLVTAKAVAEGRSMTQFLKWARLAFRGFKYQRPAVSKHLVEAIDKAAPGWTARYDAAMAGDSCNTVIHRTGLDLSEKPAAADAPAASDAPAAADAPAASDAKAAYSAEVELGANCWGDLGDGAIVASEGGAVGAEMRWRSVEDCKRHCDGLEACKSFSFTPRGRACYFKDMVVTPSSATVHNGDFMTFYKKACRGAIESFDAREYWSECRGVLSHVRHQDCNNCWSHATALVTESRLCIATDGRLNGTDAWISQSYIAMCRSDGKDYCRPGGIDAGVVTVAKSGAPTGGPDTGGNAQPGINTCVPQVKGKQKGITCPAACTQKGFPRDLKEDLFVPKFRGATRVVYGRFSRSQQLFEAAKQALLEQGPIVLGFQVYRDFSSYKSGIYTRSRALENYKLGGHAVTAMGFGSGYILCINSWGPEWGMGGAFKIAVKDVMVVAIPGVIEDIPSYPLPVV